MSKKLPYFCWFPGDFELDEKVKLMNLEEIGLYAVCLNHAWVNGSLPAEPLEISRAMKVPKAQFLRAWPRVLPCFAKREDGRYINPRQERERDAANKSLRAKREGGQKTAAMRWGSKSLSDSLATPRASDSECVSVVSEDFKEKKDGPNLRPEFDDQWQLFREIYASTGKPLIEKDFTKAHFVWRVLDIAQRTEALANLSARKTHHDPQFIPSPENYLCDGEYKRSVLPRSASGKYLTAEERAAL